MNQACASTQQRLALVAKHLAPVVTNRTIFDDVAECNTVFYLLAVVSTESILPAVQFDTGILTSMITDRPLTSVESIFAGCTYNHPEQNHYPLCINGPQCIGALVRDEVTQVQMGQPLRAFQHEGMLPHRVFREGSTPAPSPGLCILCLLDVQPSIRGRNYPGVQQQICVNDARISRTRLAEGPAGLFPVNIRSVYKVCSYTSAVGGFLTGVQQRDVFGTYAKQIARLLDIPNQPLYLTYPHSKAHDVFHGFLTRLQSATCELSRLLRIIISTCIERTLPRHTVRDATEMNQTHEFSDMYGVPAIMDRVVLELYMNTVEKSPVTTAFVLLLHQQTSKKHTAAELQSIIASERDSPTMQTDSQLAHSALARALRRSPSMAQLDTRHLLEHDHGLFTDREKWAALAIHATRSTDCVGGLVTTGIANALRARHAWRCTASPPSLLAGNMLCLSCLGLNPPIEYSMTGTAICTLCDCGTSMVTVAHCQLESMTSQPVRREPALTCAVYGCRRIRSAKAAHVIFQPTQANGIPTVVCPDHKSDFGWIGLVPLSYAPHHSRLFLTRIPYHLPCA